MSMSSRFAFLRRFTLCKALHRGALVLFLVAALLGIRTGDALAGNITVSAAASLTNAFTELKTLFEKKTGDTVTTNFAASNPLLRQMQEGAPVDVFASADQETMDKAAAGGLVDKATRKDFATNGLVLIVPAASTLKIAAASDLKAAEVRHIAVGNPDSVPAGRYARAALTAAGLWETLTPKLIVAESVRQALDYVARGEVDAGFVYATDAAIARDKVRVAVTMTGHKPVSYPIAVGTAARDAETAKRFVAFVLSPEGQAVLARYGFGKP